MGCGCSKYEQVQEPFVREAGPNDVSLYSGMPSGTLAYFGTDAKNLRHVGVVLNLSDLYSGVGLMLFECDTGGPELHDLLTGTSVSTGPRLVNLHARVRQLPEGWNVYYQFVTHPESTLNSGADAFKFCQALCADRTDLHRSIDFVAAFHAGSGCFLSDIRSTPSIEALWKGRLLRPGGQVSRFYKPIPPEF